MTTLQNRINDAISEFSTLENIEDRYRLLITYGKNLPPMEVSLKTDDNLIRGCQSQVWLHATISPSQDKIILAGDSDAAITKGIAALLIKIYSESSPSEILNTKTDFIDKIGIKEHLSQNRSNGLAAMLKQIIFFAYSKKL
ncbi:MAG: hypothetical protein A2504_07105 [Bdellovibrionales bacterium RIFOXYD12_FULL_39_22]|nr:MAG: hypothetical protein A2385_05320 [Bdellovibrionales bacterium RIFOXYB1_FULL_39_21]OFZ44343.1 MAG: hypothetical protein A2485_16100 [Bdellovibrionales bacterium RIFOXYC12_FULL_39_17]OFZ49198.1 MAG: hypothetical protein A2404_16040 [Bdellovibrionales bacterium RIFOXYC1_FULL_39_130]OFZ73763.1 MAG: hypothetical protein A2451_13505 [Bdellovibrionales bacterium RIFOXYC2_FULL_39_8]OFZ77006.1 MAG: hypothetical protein A2560_11125 [Bdellovibrionales bacterium RIFOXYD1_FULL_39_84]OFZ95219.1 MAG: